MTGVRPGGRRPPGRRGSSGRGGWSAARATRSGRPSRRGTGLPEAGAAHGGRRIASQAMPPARVLPAPGTASRAACRRLGFGVPKGRRVTLVEATPRVTADRGKVRRRGRLNAGCAVPGRHSARKGAARPPPRWGDEGNDERPAACPMGLPGAARDAAEPHHRCAGGVPRNGWLALASLAARIVCRQGSEGAGQAASLV
jgi:hypothetical protein